MSILHEYSSCILHELHNTIDIIPADYVIANIVAAAWDVGTRERVTKLQQDSIICDEDKILIYNSVSSPQKPITSFQCIKMNEVVGLVDPLSKAIWYYFFLHCTNFYSYQIVSFFLHTIPGIIGDTIAPLIGQKPMFMDTYRKLHKFTNALRYFTTHNWNFRNENVQKLWSKLNSVDRKLFNFNMDNLDWEDYFQYHWRGIRLYLLNDPLDNLQQARVRYNKLRMLHYTVVTIFWLLVLWIAVFFVSFFWS